MVFLASVAVVGCAPAQKDMSSGPRFTGEVRRLDAAPPATPQPIDPALKALARKQVTAAAQSKDPLIRAHAMESIRQVGGSDGSAEVTWALGDNEAIVRYAAALAAGEMRLADAHAQLLKMLDDPDRSVQVAVRFALHRLRDKRRSHDLESFARDPDVTVRADTAMALGMIEEPSALNILRDMQFDRDGSVRVQVFEAMWRLGSTDGRDQLVATTFSNYIGYQAVAYLALARPRDPSVMPHIRPGLTSPYNQVALVSARAAGMLGSDVGYTLAVQGTASKLPQERALAAFALGAIGRSDTQPVLAKLLDDVDPDVRLAAATAVLQLRDGR
jgi:HEAT repeat protein